MSNKKINKVRVIVDFPGYKVGDVLQLDPVLGVFHFINTTKEDGMKGDAFDIFASKLTDMKPSLSKVEVMSYIGTLFEDVSTYKVRSAGELGRRMDEIKSLIDRLEDDNTIFGEGLDRKEALTVWQNMLWEYEWIMGMRDLYNHEMDYSSKSSSNEAFVTDNEQIDSLVKDNSFIDGNVLEEEQNESNTDNENRESY